MASYPISFRDGGYLHGGEAISQEFAGAKAVYPPIPSTHDIDDVFEQDLRFGVFFSGSQVDEVFRAIICQLQVVDVGGAQMVICASFRQDLVAGFVSQLHLSRRIHGDTSQLPFLL